MSFQICTCPHHKFSIKKSLRQILTICFCMPLDTYTLKSELFVNFLEFNLTLYIYINSSLILFLTCWIFIFYQRVIRLISIIHWSKFSCDVKCSCFPLNFLQWCHEKKRPFLMTLHRKKIFLQIIRKKG